MITNTQNAAAPVWDDDGLASAQQFRAGDSGVGAEDVQRPPNHRHAPLLGHYSKVNN